MKTRPRSASLALSWTPVDAFVNVVLLNVCRLMNENELFDVKQNIFHLVCGEAPTVDQLFNAIEQNSIFLFCFVEFGCCLI